MKKKFFRPFLSALFLTALCGCSSSSYLAISSSGNMTGGIYQVTDGSPVQKLALPTLNYLIKSPDNAFLYGTVARMPGRSKRRIGGVAFIEARSDMMILRKLVSTEGQTPCHLAISPDGRHLYTANYSNGDISEFKLENGYPVSPPRHLPHTGHSVTRRQKSPHPHFVGFHPVSKQLFVCDLGTDEIWIYDRTADGVTLPCTQKLTLAPGSGPRHLVFSPDGKTIFVANELSSTVTSFHNRKGKWHLIKTASTRKGDAVTPNYPGAIKMTSCGKLFFVTNRGDDNIAMFTTLPNGEFKLVKTVASGGKYPSDILLMDDDRTLLTVNLKSGTAARFTLNKAAADLIPVAGEIPVPRGIGLCVAE